MKIINFKSAAIAIAAMFGTSAAAAVVDILPANETTVQVTADLAGLGLSGAPTGTATAAGGVFSFAITGGTVDTDTGAARIEHDGSGVALFAISDASIRAEVGNFVIDTALGGVFGNVNGGTDFFRLFDLATATTAGIPLLIAEPLSGALNATFNAGNDLGLKGAQFGIANTNPTVAPVPLPASAVLLIAGLGGLGAAARRRKKAA